jgi:DNA repair protein RecO (recombination protein O)
LEVKDRFIILRAMKYSEADLILHAISTHGEKLSFMARGALKSKKRFSGGILEPSHFVQFTYKQSAGENRINTISEATLINDFKKIRQDYDHLEFALHVLECVSKVSQEGDRHSEGLFNLLGNTLKAIESCNNVPVLKMHFYLKFLFQQGILTAENWMGIFLKTNMADSNQLAEDASIQKDVALNLYFIETITNQYLKTAENH